MVRNGKHVTFQIVSKITLKVLIQYGHAFRVLVGGRKRKRGEKDKIFIKEDSKRKKIIK